MSKKNTSRCPWVGIDKPDYARYHDKEWGVSVRDDQILFEFLILEGAQAGLNWETILKRRADYKKAFCNFDPKKVAKLSDQYLEKLMSNEKIIRNRLKIFSTRKNAQVFLKIQHEFDTFSNYLWGFVDHQKVINKWKTMSQVFFVLRPSWGRCGRLARGRDCFIFKDTGGEQVPIDRGVFRAGSPIPVVLVEYVR